MSVSDFELSPGEDGRSANIDLVNVYLQQIGQYPLLDKEGEVELAQKVVAGVEARERLESPTDEYNAMGILADCILMEQGKEAKQVFVQSNLRLVVSIARRYKNPVPLLDIIQEGNLGLEHAVDKFDWRKGFKFSTYATWWIRQAIGRGIRRQARVVSLPVNNVMVQDFAQLEDSGRSDEEICQELFIEPGELQRMRHIRRASEAVSLDRPISANSETTMHHLLPDRSSQGEFEDAETAITSDVLGHRMDQILSERERYMIRRYYGIGFDSKISYAELGKEYGITSEAARRYVKRAMDKLRSDGEVQKLA